MLISNVFTQLRKTKKYSASDLTVTGHFYFINVEI